MESSGGSLDEELNCAALTVSVRALNELIQEINRSLSIRIKDLWILKWRVCGDASLVVIPVSEGTEWVYKTFAGPSTSPYVPYFFGM